MSLFGERTKAALLLVAMGSTACQLEPKEESRCHIPRIAQTAPSLPSTEAPEALTQDAEARALSALKGAKSVSDELTTTKDYWDCRVLEAEAQYKLGSLMRRSAAFAWHHTASVAIFVVVLFIVCGGFVLAGIQFYQGLAPRMRRKDRGEKLLGAHGVAPGLVDFGEPSSVEHEHVVSKEPSRGASDVGASNHELELSLQTVRLKSNALGLVIWVVSIAFFYLYLRYVYPIYERLPVDDTAMTSE